MIDTKDVDKNDVKAFDVPVLDDFLDRIKDMEKKPIDIEVLIFVSVASNVYILNVLSALSKFLRNVFDKNKEVTIKINFLLVSDIIKYSNSIHNSFIKHNEKIIPNIGEKKHEERLTSLIQITSFNFKSTVNNVLLGLEGYKEKMNDIVCNNINFVDIDDYYKDCENDGKKIEEVVEKIGIPGEWEQVEDVKDIIFDPKYNIFEKIMKSIVYSVNTTKAEIIVVIESEIMTDHIETFFKEYNNNSKLPKNIEMIHYSEPPPLHEMLFYLNILSKYFNEGKSINDEYYFANVLGTLKSGSIFPHVNLKEIYNTKLKAYKINYNQLNDLEELKNLITEDPNTELLKTKKEIDELLNKKNKKIKEVMRNINDGFVDIQESIISQLGLII